MEEYQKRNIRKHVRSYKYMQILHGMALYAIAWHDISVSLSSVSNCLILSCLELCCVVLSCAVPHCILHGSVRCLVLNSAVHYCVVYCVLQVLYCVALRFVAVCCVLFHSSSVFLGENIPVLASRVICKLSPAWSPLAGSFCSLRSSKYGTMKVHMNTAMATNNKTWHCCWLQQILLCYSFQI